MRTFLQRSTPLAATITVILTSFSISSCGQEDEKPASTTQTSQLSRSTEKQTDKPNISSKRVNTSVVPEKELAKIRSRAKIPILLPDRSALDKGYLQPEPTVDSDSYQIDVLGAPDCEGAAACILAYFAAARESREDRPDFKENVRLAKGLKGRFKPQTCSLNCAPSNLPTINWYQDGTFYTVSQNVDRANKIRLESRRKSVESFRANNPRAIQLERETLVKSVNSAILAGQR